MQEKPFFFEDEAKRLFGILHLPPAPKPQGYVFCHPFAEEKLWSHRVFVNFARRLCRAGHPVLRFDYRGHGDSSGDFEDATVETRVADIQSAIDTLCAKVEGLAGVGLIGLRFGASLAALAAENDTRVNALVLWEPVVKGAQHIKEMLRINITTQTAVYKEVRYNTQALIEQMRAGQSVNIDGYEIKLPFYEQIAALDLTKTNGRFEGNVLAAQINKKAGLGMRRIQALEKAYPQITMIEVVEMPFWKEIREYYATADDLFARTLAWMEIE